MMLNSFESASKKAALCLSLLSVLIFLYGNSLIPGADSAKESVAFFDVLVEWFSFLPFFTHAFVRKLAHFAEYTLLGIHLAFMYLTFGHSQKRKIVFWLCAGFLVALTDEWVQTMVPGRYASFVDVGIDFFGILSGLVLIWLAFSIYVRKKRKKATAR